MWHIVTFFSLFCAVLSIFSHPADSSAESKSTDKLSVYVVNYPLKYFAERIAGEHATVRFPAPPDADPAYWMPDAETVSAYQRADLILLNGATYAKWVDKVTIPLSRTVDTSAGFRDRTIRLADSVSHTHGPKGKHAHEGIAFTTWLDLELAAGQAKAIKEALSRKRPGLKEVFQQNFAALENDLLALDREAQGVVANNRKQPLVASHPVYQYFVKQYGLNVRSVHWEPGRKPTGKQWFELKVILKDHPAKWLIWEGTPEKETSEKLKAMGIGSVVFDPCGNVPVDGDFLNVMRQNVENLKGIFP
jgi:zinc transport system substrate-binding protein